MRRLATLLSVVQPRGDDDVVGLLAAARIYQQLLREPPDHEQREQTLATLAATLAAADLDEPAQQVHRALECPARYPYPVASDPQTGHDMVVRLPQDHRPEWWLGWMKRHPQPLPVAGADGPG